MRILIIKNGGDSSSVASEGESYANVQRNLANEVARHIAENPLDQQIESVSIKWKRPLVRDYEYLIKED